MNRHPSRGEPPPGAPTRTITAGPDAPTRRFASTLRGALAGTRPLRTASYRRLWLAGIVTMIGRSCRSSPCRRRYTRSPARRRGSA